MASNPIVRVSDQISGTCNAHSPPCSVTGIWDTGSPSSIDQGKAIVRIGDTGTASCGHSFFAVTGSSVMTCEGIGEVRIGDQVNIQGGAGVCVTGSSTDVSA